MPFLKRKFTALRGAGVVEVRGHQFAEPTDQLTLMDMTVEITAGGGTVDIEILGELGWIVERTGLGELEQLTIKNPAHALRATWVGGSGGGITVIASPKWDGAI